MSTLDLSKEKFAESQRYLAGGVSSSLRSSMKPTPLFARSGSGARVTDIDGNEYIDFLLAYGPLILGHAHPQFNERISMALQNGATYGLQHEAEIGLAKRLTEILPCAEKAAFSGSGTEAVMLALRLAKAYTKRDKIVRFYGHYHGWSDAIFTSFPSSDMKQSASGDILETAVTPGTSGQNLHCLEDIILVPWNDTQALERVLQQRGQEIAAVITEPVMCNSGCIVPRTGYLERMRELTEKQGIVLIFDEVITGFRLGASGSYDYFHVVPDLMTMGKALGNGIALSAVAGNNSIMELISSGKVNHLGTLNGNCVSMEAALATLDILTHNNGIIYKRMGTLAAKLADGIRTLMSKHGQRGVVNQIGPVFHMMFINQSEVTDFDTFQLRDAGKYVRFAEMMLSEGVLLRSNGLWYICAAHTDLEAEETLAAMDRVLARI